MTSLRLRAGSNVALRMATTASKFVLLFFLARFLEVADVGVYGLVVATIGLALLVLGMDFYTYSSRAMLAAERQQWPRMLRDQAAFHLLVYVVALPASWLLFAAGLLPWSVAPWFYALLVLEHASQELYRFLVTDARPLRANVALFLRGGIWVPVVVIGMLVWPGTRNLEFVWLAWLGGLVLGLGVTLPALRKFNWHRIGGVDAAWITRGVAVALPFLLATTSHWGIVTFDRWILQWARDAAAVGVYSFYAGIVRVLFLFAEAGVVMVLYPHIVGAYQQGRIPEYRRRMRQLRRGVVALIGVAAVLLVAGIHPVLRLLNRPEYGQHLSAYVLLLLATMCMAWGLVPHLALYAQRRDRAIIAASAAGLVSALAADLLLAPRFGLDGVAAGTLLGFAVIATGKTLAERRARESS